MKRGRAQYSVEFLVTYGWAILIIGIIIAAIYAFGWLDVQNFLPQKCTFYGQVGCRDFEITNSGLNLSLDNNFGAHLYIKSIEIRNVDCRRVFSDAVFWERARFAMVGIECPGIQDISGTRKEILVSIGFFSNTTCSGCVSDPVGTSDCPNSCIHTTTGRVFGRVPR